MRRPTIHDVARKAGVGIGTVSRVLNDSPQVSDTTRQRVLNAIQQLNFRPNQTARRLPRKTRLHNIGVITQPFTSYYSFAERLRGVQMVLGELEEDYELILYNVSSLENLDQQLRSIVQSGSVEGLLIIDLPLTEEQQQLLDTSGMTFIGLNCYQDTTWICIGTDNVEGGQLATGHLLEIGHTQIAYVGDTFDDSFGFTTSEERFAGYTNALREHDLEPDERYVQLGTYGYETARELTHHLLDLPEPPTAIFAMSDLQALGCITAVRETGLRVPEDISVIGYDDLEISAHTGLTTVSQHLEMSGKEGITYLLKLLMREEDAPLPVLPSPEVIPRQTTRPLP